MKNDRIKGLTGFCQRWLYLGKGGCIWTKWLYLGKLVVFRQNGCNWANSFYLGKSGSFWATVVLFGQKWFYLGKMVLFRQIGSIWAKVVLFLQRWLYCANVVVFAQNDCIWANWFYLGKLVLFGKFLYFFYSPQARPDRVNHRLSNSPAAGSVGTPEIQLK